MWGIPDEEKSNLRIGEKCKCDSMCRDNNKCDKSGKCAPQTDENEEKKLVGLQTPTEQECKCDGDCLNLDDENEIIQEGVSKGILNKHNGTLSCSKPVTKPGKLGARCANDGRCDSGCCNDGRNDENERKCVDIGDTGRDNGKECDCNKQCKTSYLGGGVVETNICRMEGIRGRVFGSGHKVCANPTIEARTAKLLGVESKADKLLALQQLPSCDSKPVDADVVSLSTNRHDPLNLAFRTHTTLG